MRSAFPLLFTFVCLPLAAQVKITQGSDRIMVDINGKPYTGLFIGSGATKPYLHPLRAASGKIVTRMYPMEIKAGEAQDHIHQRGLWFSHGDVNGFDFWANDPSQQSPKKGKILTKKVGELKDGKKSGSLTVTFEWVGGDGKPLVTETRTMTFHADPVLRIIDFDIRLTGVEKSHFGDTKEGTFAMRLAAELDGKHTGLMVNAEGKKGEKEVWGKRSPWVDYSGQVEGERLGVAILDHPANPKHPTFWHSRDYGLFAANIFGERDFLRDKALNGGLTLEPGQTWRFRYRVVIHPRDMQSAGIAELYKKFAALK